MWERLFETVANEYVRVGTLTVNMPSGVTRTFGGGDGPNVTATVDEDTLRAIVMNPEMGVGEGYMNGGLTFDYDDLYGFMELATRNVSLSKGPMFLRPIEALRQVGGFLAQFNAAGKSRRNVAHHYDLSAELYDLFLDNDKQYSCAYFPQSGMSLDAAQAAKKAHIARKLLIEPDMHVLDIGCGWGGMALTLAKDFGARVTGVTLSEEQLKIAKARAKAEGLDGRVEFRLMDYRAVPETFDRVVSVGMFEHVGRPQFRTYFEQVGARMNPDGVALIHTIGRTDPPGRTSPWIQKYIFPGGYIPAMSETMAAVEKADLYPCDVEVWRLHYAETLRHWHDRFVAQKDAAIALYDETFYRMWRYYLIAAEMTFRFNHQAVFQFQLAHDQQAVPLSRDYLYPVSDTARMAAE